MLVDYSKGKAKIKCGKPGEKPCPWADLKPQEDASSTSRGVRRRSNSGPTPRSSILGLLSRRRNSRSPSPILSKNVHNPSLKTLLPGVGRSSTQPVLTGRVEFTVRSRVEGAPRRSSSFNGLKSHSTKSYNEIQSHSVRSRGRSPPGANKISGAMKTAPTLASPTRSISPLVASCTLPAETPIDSVIVVSDDPPTDEAPTMDELTLNVPVDPTPEAPTKAEYTLNVPVERGPRRTFAKSIKWSRPGSEENLPGLRSMDRPGNMPGSMDDLLNSSLQSLGMDDIVDTHKNPSGHASLSVNDLKKSRLPRNAPRRIKSSDDMKGKSQHSPRRRPRRTRSTDGSVAMDGRRRHLSRSNSAKSLGTSKANATWGNKSFNGSSDFLTGSRIRRHAGPRVPPSGSRRNIYHQE